MNTHDESIKAPAPHPHEGAPLQEGSEAPPPGVRAMAVIRWTLVVLMAVLAAVSIATWMQERSKNKAAGASETQYYCPMHPQVVQDSPGECPICGMDLVPRKPAPTAADAPKSDVHGLVPIELSPDRIQLIGMRTATVTREKLHSDLRTVGFVTADETALAHVHTRFAGWVERMSVNSTGEYVKEGQELLTVYSPELFTAQAEYLNALRWQASGSSAPAPGSDSPHVHGGAVDPMETLAADARRRLELLGISPPEIREIERSGRPIRSLPIRSPVAGYVVQKTIVPGNYIQPGTDLFSIADLSRVWVIADVYEYEISRIKGGEPAKIQLSAWAGKTFNGKVDFIYPMLDPDSRTLRVRMLFANKGLQLRPGMYGDVLIDLPSQEGLVVPSEAIVDTGTQRYVFLALPGGKFEPRRVSVGTRSNGKIQVLEGVAEGDVVVTTANFLIDSESRLEAALRGAASEPAPGATGDAGRAPPAPAGGGHTGHAPGSSH